MIRVCICGSFAASAGSFQLYVLKVEKSTSLS